MTIFWLVTANQLASADPLQGSVTEDSVLAKPTNLRIARPAEQEIPSPTTYSNNITQDVNQQVATPPENSAVMNDGSVQQNFAPPMTGYINQQQAPLNSPPQLNGAAYDQSEADPHGESHMGVLGCKCNVLNGVVMYVLPGSDLNRFGIHSGDQLLEIDGHPFNYLTFVKYCHGTPGSTMAITIMHDGQIEQIPVRRMDGRQAYGEAGGSKWANAYKWAAEQNHYW